jgi:hypothetical protein
MANFPPLFLNASGLPERLTTADGGLEAVVVDVPVAASPVDLFAAVTSPGGSVTMFSAYAGIMNIGAAGSTAAFAGDFTAVGTGIFGSTVTIGNTSAAPTLSLGGGDVTKYIEATGIAGTIATPSIRYDHVAHRWGFTDGDNIWYTFLSAGTTWDGIYSTDKTLDINSTAVAWTQTGSNTGSAFTVARTLAAGDTNAPLVHFSGSGDFAPLLVTNSSTVYGIDLTLDNAVAGAQGLVVRNTAAHTATNPALNVFNASTGLSVWQVTHAGSQIVPGGVLRFGLITADDGCGFDSSVFFNQIAFQISSSYNYALVFGADNGIAAQNFGHGTCADPTIFGHSATLPSVNQTQWWSLTHNQTDSLMASGAGGQVLAPFTGAIYFDAAGQVGKAFAIKTFHQIITLDITGAETWVGLTPGDNVVAAAIRVDTQIDGLGAADHHIQLGVTGTPTKYCDVAEGDAVTYIESGIGTHWTGTPAAEPAALLLTIAGGGNNTPSAGTVEVFVVYYHRDNLPNTL